MEAVIGENVACDNYIDNLLEYFTYLPLTLTHKSEHRSVRFVGFFAQLFWMLPALLITGLPFLVLLFGTFIENVWEGTF
jgi:hypothetical protein